MIKLSSETISKEDIDCLVEWLQTYPKLTKGSLTVEFEDKWSDWLGTKYSTFVNSGSSANLLMLATLLEAGDLEIGDHVVVPALSWATDVAPIMQLGLKPILCDCNLVDYSVDIKHFRKLTECPEVKAAILVPLLGFVPDMEAIGSICTQNRVILLEDCCESLGSEYKGGKLGSFGAMSTFSTFFGHHISTIEGGVVCTSNEKYNKILKSIRSHGWARDWSESDQKDIEEEWGVSDFDALYTFYHSGFNVRSTDLQAFLGIRQLDKIDSIIAARNANYKLYLKLLGLEDDSTYLNSNFAFPIIHEDRDTIIKLLQEAGVECRPLVCGSMSKQPFYLKKYPNEVNRVPNAEYVRKYGMYLPNHASLTSGDILQICNIVRPIINGENE